MSSLTIELPDDQKAALVAKAKALGLTPEEYARQVLQQDLVPDWLKQAWDNSRSAGLDRMSVNEVDAEIAAARKARRGSRSNPSG